MGRCVFVDVNKIMMTGSKGCQGILLGGWLKVEVSQDGPAKKCSNT